MLLFPEEGEGGIVADAEAVGGYAGEKLAVLGVPTGQLFLGEGGSYASAGSHPSVPGLSCEGDIQVVFFVIFKLEVIICYLGDMDRFPGLSGSRPIGAVLQDEFFTFACYRIL